MNLLCDASYFSSFFLIKSENILQKPCKILIQKLAKFKRFNLKNLNLIEKYYLVLQRNSEKLYYLIILSL